MSPNPPSSRAVTGRYDTKTDVLSVRFTESEVVESREFRPGIAAAYDAAGAVVRLEIRDASSGRLVADQDLRRLAVAA